jgi:hypothetical protein
MGFNASRIRFSAALVITLLCAGRAFHIIPRPAVSRSAAGYRQLLVMLASQNSPREGDPLRAATGIRPSLHPVTINAIANVLKSRANNSSDFPLRADQEAGIEPLQVALSAGRIAAEAIAKRQASSSTDGMKLQPDEEQAIAGRVVGVTMRLDMLEKALSERCRATSWVAKYAAWDSFGVLQQEELSKEVDRRILDDPLFGMSRAECLLALFLTTVEAPALELQNIAAAGGSQVDFLDEDRKEALLLT